MQTRIIKIDLQKYRPDLLKEASASLARGGLVIFPTETVYGIGCHAENPAALDRLYEIKARPRDKPFTIHIADTRMLDRHVPQIPYLAKKLMQRYWPGPLTLVLTDRKGQKIGLRLPDHKVARDLIMQAAVPVAAPSANLSGAPPPENAAQALEVFDGVVDYVIDAGPASFGVSSTVVAVDGRRWRILRPGAISQEAIAELACLNILFVCTGNTCRSAMAEGLLKMRLSRCLDVPVQALPSAGIIVRSAGTAAVDGAPASNGAVEIMRVLGCDIRSHTATALTMELCDEADRIYVMTPRHRETLLEWMPHMAEKIYLVGAQTNGIADPVDSGPSGYAACAQKLLNYIDSEILNDEDCFSL